VRGHVAVIAAAVTAFAVAFAWLQTSQANGAARSPVVLRVGDTVRIAGTDVGCAVARRGGATMVECLPAHRKPGAYATLAGDERVLVVRFGTRAVAHTVFEARQHNSHTTTCK
jgi:hypothetical protein